MPNRYNTWVISDPEPGRPPAVVGRGHLRHPATLNLAEIRFVRLAPEIWLNEHQVARVALQGNSTRTDPANFRVTAEESEKASVACLANRFAALQRLQA